MERGKLLLRESSPVSCELEFSHPWGSFLIEPFGSSDFYLVIYPLSACCNVRVQLTPKAQTYCKKCGVKTSIPFSRDYVSFEHGYARAHPHDCLAFFATAAPDTLSETVYESYLKAVLEFIFYEVAKVRPPMKDSRTAPPHAVIVSALRGVIDAYNDRSVL